MPFSLVVIFILLAASASSSNRGGDASPCYESIVGFGDSLTDTGNYPQLCAPDNPTRYARPPYGRTFFHRPTGRCSDGRLIIDFIAQSLGLPLVQPYFAGGEGGRSFSKGVNFAVVGSSALDYEFYEKIGFPNIYTNVTLGVQFGWLKQFLATIPDGRIYLEKSLVLMGEIGGNDYNHPIMQRASLEAIQPLVHLVIQYIGSTIEKLINLGAKTVLVPGLLPLGCAPIYLTEYMATSNPRDYDPETGCLKRLNDFAINHNDLFQKELGRIRQLYPEANVIYADYYNAAIQLYLHPSHFGFSSKNIHRACCGTGGPYNYNEAASCSIPPATTCSDPSSYVSWDGIHFTEAAYKLVAQGLLRGPYATPHITTICPSLTNRIAQVYEY